MSTESRIEARDAKAPGGVVAEGRKHDAAAEALSQAASTFIDLTRHFHQQWEGMGRIMDEGTVSAEAHALRETCSRLYRLSKSGLDALAAAQAREVDLADWRDEVRRDAEAEAATKAQEIYILATTRADALQARETWLRERLQAIIDWADLALKNPQEFDGHGVRNLDGPVFDEARLALSTPEAPDHD